MHEGAGDDFIVFGAPDLRDEEFAEVETALRSGWIGTGPRVAEFEERFAGYKGVDAARVAAVNSCTAALHVSMIAAGLREGDEVLTTANTFCATANAIIHAGATPVPVDIDPQTFNMDAQLLEARLTDRTRAIVPVHFAGRPCDMDAIVSFADRHGLVVIEDCAHAVETEWRGRPAGTLGQFGCFSFYVTKNVTTGEGGMVVARSKKDVERIKVLSLHGMTKDAWHRYSDRGYRHYRVIEAGFKYNMMDIQAALGLHQVARVEQNWARRREIWQRYQLAFEGLPAGRPPEPEPGTRHGFHLYTLTIDEDRCGLSRDAFMQRLFDAGVGTGVHYLSLAAHPYYQERYGWKEADFPQAQRYGETTVSIPLSPRLTDIDVERVIEAVTTSLAGPAHRAS